MNVPNIDNQSELLQYIQQCLKPKEKEKKQFGEVFTPMELVNEMLDKLPHDVWSNPNLKWFDPANGMGNYPIAIYYRLMNGLKDVFVNESSRKKHILENMLYMSELNIKNCYICNLIFNPNNEYKLNLHCGDSLKLNTEKEWGVDKFDIIIGNPPYQAQRKKENETKGGGGDLLWNKFVFKCLELLKEKGYMTLIHPSGWRKPEGLDATTKSKYLGLMDKLVRENYMIYLNIYNTSDGLKVFSCGTRFDYYLVHKVKPTEFNKTIIKDEDGVVCELNLSNIIFIPNKNIIKISKLVSLDKQQNLIVLRPGGDPRRDYISDKEDSKFCFKMIHSTPNTGVRYKYASIKKETDHFDIPKIIFGETNIDNLIYDKYGQFGVTCCSYGLSLVNYNEYDIECLINILKSLNFKEILNSCSWSNYRIDWRLFTYFKKDFWKEFN